MIVLLCLSIMHLLEAWLEKVVIDLKGYPLPGYTKLNKQEHFRSAVLAGFWLACATAVILVYTQEYWIIPALVINRRIFFDYTLILLRGRPADKYEGTDWWMKKLSKLFSGNRVIELLVQAAITIFCIVIS